MNMLQSFPKKSLCLLPLFTFIVPHPSNNPQSACLFSLSTKGHQWTNICKWESENYLRCSHSGEYLTASGLVLSVGCLAGKKVINFHLNRHHKISGKGGPEKREYVPSPLNPIDSYNLFQGVLIPHIDWHGISRELSIGGVVIVRIFNSINSPTNSLF